MLSLFEPEMTMLEQTKLQQYEAVIERGLQTFVDVGNALIAIRDEKLYRPHQTFDEYCRKRWGFSDERARILMRSAEVVANLTPTNIGVLPGNAEQAKPLINLSPDDQREAWQKAVETAPDGKITGAHVAAVVERYKQPEPEAPAIDLETGEIFTDTPILEAPAPNRAYKNSSESNEWYTPRRYIDKAIELLGGIDLDPASSDAANEIVQAKRFFTIEDNALIQDWFGRVWLNPPYGNDVEPFVEKLILAYGAGDVTEALLLVAARTDTVWFRSLHEYARCFISGRIKFVNGETGEPGDPAGFPSMIVYLGRDDQHFIDVFKSEGDIYVWEGR